MYGVVLCGGKSSRMGTDKALLTQPDGVSWLEKTSRLFEQLDIKHVISCSAEQENKYRETYPNKSFCVDQNSFQGPVKGVMSAYAELEEDLFVIACDMIQMDSVTMNSLMELHKEDSSFDAYVYADEKHYQPLCAIYTQQGLEKIKAYYKEQFSFNFSFQFLLENVLSVHKAKILGEQNHLFKNYNSKEDLGQ